MAAKAQAQPMIPLVLVDSETASRVGRGKVDCALVAPDDFPEGLEIGRQIDLGAPTQRRGQPRRVRLSVTLTARASLIIAEHGVVRVTGLAYGGVADGLGLLLQAAEQGSPRAAEHAEKLAQRLGFRSWATLWRAETRETLGAKSPGARIDCRIVGWA